MRYGVHIYVATSVMDEAAFIPEEEEEEEEAEAKPPQKAKQQPPTLPKTKLEQLQHMLKEAIDKENYEKAAQLRDEIQRMSSHEN